MLPKTTETEPKFMVSDITRTMGGFGLINKTYFFLLFTSTLGHDLLEKSEVSHTCIHLDNILGQSVLLNLTHK